MRRLPTPIRFSSARPLAAGALVLNIPLFIAVIVKGRWSALMRRLEAGLSLVHCAVMAWTVLDGPVFMAPSQRSRRSKLILVLIVAFTLVSLGIERHRSVRPTPARA